MDKQFAVLGLGSFGSSVALTLENMGCDVLVVDESYEKVQEISDKVSYAVKADVSEPDALQALGGRNLDGVVVAISESLEASIMATMLCKEMGIPLVVAKAKDKLQGAILQRVGADRIVYPEIEMGSRVAKSLVSKEFVDWISLSNDYSMVEIVVPQNWVGKTDLRHAISLNDSFRFAREIFGGDTARMNEVIRQLGAAPSLEKALELFSSTVNPDEENETVVDFIELLKKYFS